MDSIWGDPWADDEKPELPLQKTDPVNLDEVKDYRAVEAAPDVLPTAFEDEAGWGNFEGNDGARSEDEESHWDKHQGHTDVRSDLAPEPSFELANGLGIRSPGWGSVQTLTSTSNQLPDGKQDGDDLGLPPSPIWESPRSGVSSSPQPPTEKYGESASEKKDHDEISVSGQSPRLSSSSTTKTAVSSDTDRSSGAAATIPHTDGKEWTEESSHSETSDRTGIRHSLESGQTSFDVAYGLSHRKEEDSSIDTVTAKLGDLDSSTAPALVRASEENSPKSSYEQAHIEGETQIRSSATRGPHFSVDLALVTNIFKHVPASKEFMEAKDELIESTSIRKAWYRLARPETMREFNMGATDDSYVRVSWPKSQIRADSLKIINRWASEDRINGRVVLGGKPGAAAFGWDTPRAGPIVSPRQLSVKEQASTTEEGSPPNTSPGRHFLEPRQKRPATSSPAAHFDWSTSTTGNNRRGSGTIVSLGDVLATPLVSAVPEAQLQAGKHRLTESGSNSATLPLVQSNMTATKDRGTLPSIDTTDSTLNANTIEGEGEDDDDEWGEMVKSPSAPQSHLMLPRPIAGDASEIEPSVMIDQQVPFDSDYKTFTPKATFALEQCYPDVTLSPVRRAASDAARATGVIHSQQHQEEILPDRSRETDLSTSKTSEPRATCPSPLSSFITTQPLSAIDSIRVPSYSKSSGITDQTSSPELGFTTFDCPQPQEYSQHTEHDSISVQLSPTEEERAQQIVRNIPNLSFMLR